MVITPGKQLGKAHQQAVSELIHIRDHPADDIPVGMAVHIFQRQCLDMSEGLLPDIPDHTVGNFIIADIHQPLGRCRQGNHHRHPLQDTDNPLQIHLARPHSQIYRLAG